MNIELDIGTRYRNPSMYWNYDLVIENGFLRKETNANEFYSQFGYIKNENYSQKTGKKKADIYRPLWWTNEQDLYDWIEWEIKNGIIDKTFFRKYKINRIKEKLEWK